MTKVFGTPYVLKFKCQFYQLAVAGVGRTNKQKRYNIGALTHTRTYSLKIRAKLLNLKKMLHL